MNHPKPEEWVPFLYGETIGENRRALKSHLESCADCRQHLDTWKQSVEMLDHWKVPRPKRAASVMTIPWFGWATATALLLFCGVLIGRATSPKVDVDKLRAALAPEIRKQISSELEQTMRDEAAKSASLALASGRRYTDQVAQQLYVSLKKDVETVALNADAGLRDTARQLFQLADSNEQ
ncbi:MAG TPA: hypothetical protein VKY92_21575 [Verrucomicrobiae bacterium]|nr:hypothetical protein [Verrucomicrobiae bacterium]